MATPLGTKRKDHGTPTPEDFRSDGARPKRGRGEPIPMEDTAEAAVGEIAAMSYADAAMAKAQEDALKLAPDWAKVILGILRTDIKNLNRADIALKRALNHNDSRITTIEGENSKLTQIVKRHNTAFDELNLKFAKLESSYKKLEERVIRHEVQARKTNIMFCGIPEDGVDSWDSCRQKVNHVIALMGLGADPREIMMDKVHRVGPPLELPGEETRNPDRL
jgi:hypothetical protein